MSASPLRALALTHRAGALTHRAGALAPRAVVVPFAAAVLAASAMAFAARGTQEPPLPPGVIPGAASARSGEWLASDDEPAAAGRIPKGTSDAARERFGKLAGRLSHPAEVRSFTLRFDLEMRTEANAAQEVRRTEFRYLDEGPGWVYGAFLNKDGTVKQCQMRGPRENGGRGYWQVLKDGTEVDLRGGDDFSESRAELDGWAALCHDLLLLQQPTRLRLVRLEARTATRAGDEGVAARTLVFGKGDVVVLPDAVVAVGSEQKLAERALGLEWLEVVTPDIRLWRDAAEVEAARRVLLGVDPSIGVPELAVLTQRIEGRIVDAGTTLLHLADWRPLGSRPAKRGAEPAAGAAGGTGWLPHATRLFELREAVGPERELAPVVFQNAARLDLFLLPGGSVGGDPPKASDFRPAPR